MLPSFPSSTNPPEEAAEDKDHHIIRITPCKDGIWASCLYKGKSLILVNLAGFRTAPDDDVILSDDFIHNLKWNAPLEDKLTINHGNAFVFTESSYPAGEYSKWYHYWVERSFELTQSVPLSKSCH